MAGVKHDKGKPRIDLIPSGAILEIAEVLTSGAKEYGDYNWRKGIAYSRLYAAIQRHLLAFWNGKDIDGSGHRALAHAATDLLMLLEMDSSWDDRYGKDTERFWKKVNIREFDKCWNWQAGYYSSGYGAFSLKGKNHRAHRIAWEFTYGSIPQDMYVCHHCDNPGCCNPNHLFLGSQSDNMKDRMIKKPNKGEENGFHKLTEKKVREIKQYLEEKSLSQQQIANIYKVHQATISLIKTGRYWSHVT
jgi:predicted XRE-type DNA-binding protein